MRFSRLLVFVLLAALMLIPLSAQEDMMHSAPQLIITGGWARATATAAMAESMQPATPEGGMGEMGEMKHDMPVSDGGVSAAYMFIENPTETTVALVGGSTPYAEMVQIHEIIMENEVMKMRELENGLEIPAGETAELKQGGYHVMLLGLKYPFVDGQAVSLTLTFEYAGMGGEVETFDVVLGLPVRQEPPAPDAVNVVALDAWARPTAPAMLEMNQQHDLDEPVTPDTEGEGGEMGDMGDMGGMQMPSGVSAAYMVLLNRGDTPLKVVSASSPAAVEVQIHETVVENDVAKMQELTAGLDLPAGERVELKPGGLHIMLIDLVKPIAPGEAILVTLTFETGETLTLGVPVYDKGEMMMMH